MNFSRLCLADEKLFWTATEPNLFCQFDLICEILLCVFGPCLLSEMNSNEVIDRCKPRSAEASVLEIEKKKNSIIYGLARNALKILKFNASIKIYIITQNVRHRFETLGHLFVFHSRSLTSANLEKGFIIRPKEYYRELSLAYLFKQK